GQSLWPGEVLASARHSQIAGESREAGMAEGTQAPVNRYDPFDGGLGFSLATRVGNVVYTSGMVGVDAELNVPEDPAEEFRRVFENLAGVLAELGTSLDHVIESTNFF